RKRFGNAVEGGGDDWFAARERFADDQSERFGTNLRMDQTINRVHRARHVVDIRRQPRLACETEPFDVGLQNVCHGAATDDQEAGLRNLSVDARGGSEELTLSLAARQRIAANHGERVVFRAESPLAPLRFNLLSGKRAETPGVNAAVDDMNPRVVAQQWWAGAALWFGRVGFVNAFA